MFGKHTILISTNSGDRQISLILASNPQSHAVVEFFGSILQVLQVNQVPPSLTLPKVSLAPAPSDPSTSSPVMHFIPTSQSLPTFPLDHTTTSSSIAATTPPFSHRMITGAMNNIYMPKHMYIVTEHPLPDSLEPTCVNQTLKHPQW